MTRRSEQALAEMFRAQRSAVLSLRRAYAEASQYLVDTRDEAGAEARYARDCDRIRAAEREECDRLLAEATRLLERELGRRPQAGDVREMRRLADEIERTAL
jgi:hypothetical protein